jgi:hypothetical protein
MTITFELIAALAVWVSLQVGLVLALLALRRAVDRLERVAKHRR